MQPGQQFSSNRLYGFTLCERLALKHTYLPRAGDSKGNEVSCSQQCIRRIKRDRAQYRRQYIPPYDKLCEEARVLITVPLLIGATSNDAAIQTTSRSAPVSRGSKQREQHSSRIQAAHALATPLSTSQAPLPTARGA
eukprot:6186703-Pleurochrysis_carterae.AAC.5